jgi:hypothetical protein
VTLARLTVIGAILLCFSACSNSQIASNTGKYKPIINTHPRYFVSVSGHIDPQINHSIQLKLVARYTSTLKACDIDHDKFEGIVNWRWRDVVFEPVRDQAGDYYIKIPLDYYRPGYCHWSVASINDFSGILSTPESTLMTFAPCGNSATCITNKTKITNLYKHKAIYNNYCHESGSGEVKCSPGKSTFFSDGSSVPRNQNYQFIQNYYLQKEL